jgi:hypothetical protein
MGNIHKHRQSGKTSQKHRCNGAKIKRVLMYIGTYIETFETAFQHVTACYSMLQHISGILPGILRPGLAPEDGTRTGTSPSYPSPLSILALFVGIMSQFLRGLYSAGFIPASFNEAPDEMMHPVDSHLLQSISVAPEHGF